ncbi:PspC domain-containing protein [Sphingomonas cavernae]|nr:PspC domain-containing protein [Sphingomonas cavernae]
MQVSRPSAAKEDNLFGVCAALGEDFGFNPLLLRIVLGASLLWNPVAVLGGYAAVGLVVAVSRWLYPGPRRGADLVENEVVQNAPAAGQSMNHLPDHQADDKAVEMAFAA